jgi:monoamine oxidase
MKKPLTRRHFLNLVGAAGGTTAVYNTSIALGLMQETGAVAQLDLKHVGRQKKTVAVLGAGIAGLMVAYELERKGYEVTVIEASHRAGGRNMTVRHGDIIDEMGQRQVCDFDDDPDMYFNCGPARIPGHHRRIMHYCKTLKVPLRIKANFSRAAYRHDPQKLDGKPVPVAQYVADTRGFISELLYKAVDKNAFDQPLTANDQERIREYVRGYGDLNYQGDYIGSERGGRKSGGFINPAKIHEPIDVRSLLDSDFWMGFSAFSSENTDWGEPLMEMKGGNDMIVKAFVREIKSPIILKAPVQAIELKENGVDVAYQHKGKRKNISADYVFNSIPTHFMPAIPNNLPIEYREGLAALRPGNFFKIGLQMKERFWEKQGIYGGITETNQPINQIWYPSHGIHSEKGIVLSAYAFYSQCEFFEKMTPEERIRFAGACGDKIHPEYSASIEAGVSIPWGRINHMMGCGTAWSTGRAWEEGSSNLRDQYYELLQQPAGGRHFMIGDQISYHSSWQEGAFGSAEFALLELDRRVRAESGESRTG